MGTCGDAEGEGTAGLSAQHVEFPLFGAEGFLQTEDGGLGIVNGNAEQYNVEVTIASNHALVLSMVVEGDMGVIDAAILTNDVYNIALTDDGNRQYNYRFNGSSKSLTFEGTSYYKPSNSTSVIVDQNMR